MNAVIRGWENSNRKRTDGPPAARPGEPQRRTAIAAKEFRAAAFGSGGQGNGAMRFLVSVEIDNKTGRPHALPGSGNIAESSGLPYIISTGEAGSGGGQPDAAGLNRACAPQEGAVR